MKKITRRTTGVKRMTKSISKIGLQSTILNNNLDSIFWPNLQNNPPPPFWSSIPCSVMSSTNAPDWCSFKNAVMTVGTPIFWLFKNSNIHFYFNSKYRPFSTVLLIQLWYYPIQYLPLLWLYYHKNAPLSNFSRPKLYSTNLGLKCHFRRSFPAFYYFYFYFFVIFKPSAADS